jgi:long-chain acyl-CoA synthetase
LKGERRVGSIGLPISNTSVEVVALEPDANGNFPTLPVGEEGEVIIYGPQVMKGYWNNPEETAKTINSRGGLHTGDIVKMDKDGFLYIVDRKKDLIITGGYNIVPREVEEVLYMHPKVMEACVIGVPNALRGELVKAYIVLKPGEQATVDEIRTFCKEYLTLYKVPKSVEFRTEIPKSQVGKVLRRLLVEEEVAKQKARQEKVAARLQRQAGPEGAAKAEPKAEPKVEPKAEAKPAAKPEPKPEPKAEVKPEGKPQAETEAKVVAESNAEAKPTAETESKAEVEPKVEAGSE